MVLGFSVVTLVYGAELCLDELHGRLTETLQSMKLGFYLARIVDEVKQRPAFIVRERLGAAFDVLEEDVHAE
ncbi:MAG: hypothetical protein M3P06_14315 [Acidobacteriota bacterium]|nr:hypothetical protein [Acidobacteriota bacterium]